MNDNQKFHLRLAREQVRQGECDMSAGQLDLLVRVIDELTDTLDEVLTDEVPPLPCADLDRYEKLVADVIETRTPRPEED